MAEHGITKDEMEVVLEEVLNRRRAVDDETHKHDHEFIKMMRDREEKRVKLWMKFKLSMMGSLALSLVGGLIWVGGVVWAALKHGHPGP